MLSDITGTGSIVGNFHQLRRTSGHCRVRRYGTRLLINFHADSEGIGLVFHVLDQVEVDFPYAEAGNFRPFHKMLWCRHAKHIAIQVPLSRTTSSTSTSTNVIKRGNKKARKKPPEKAVPTGWRAGREVFPPLGLRKPGYVAGEGGHHLGP